MNLEKLMPITYCNSLSVLKLTEDLCIEVIKNGIEGDFCEAGIAMGAHGVVMRSCAKEQSIWLFDSFEGIPIHGPEDTEWTEAYGESISDPRKSGGVTVCGLEDVRATMGRYLDNLSQIIFVNGWFVETLPILSDSQKFSIVRLDCDLYDSYMTCFKYLLPKLSKGGFLIIDDFELSGCRKAILDSGLKIEDFTLINLDTVGFLQWNQ